MRKPAAALLAAALFASTAPVTAFTQIERGSSFKSHVTLAQAALCDGSVRLEPGAYDVGVSSMGDGSVRVTFFDRTGRKVGESHGIIAVLKQGAAQPGGAANSVQKVQPAGSAASSINFAKAGFGVNSPASFQTEGQKLNLQILSNDGTHAILIGLLLPAVQKVREAAARTH